MLSLYTFFTAVAIFAAGLLINNEKRKRQLRSMGCQPPPSYPRKDLVFGLDLFAQAGKMFTEHTFFPVSIGRYQLMGRTFDAEYLMKRTVHSIEPENIQKVFATDAKSWGVAAHRYDALKPYFGKGFLTTDGPEWQHSRQVFNQSFHKAGIKDHVTYDHYLSMMISKIPRDGSTVDLQDLNFALYTDTATLFLFGESFESLSRGLTDEAKGFVKSLHKSFEGCGIRLGLGPLKFLYRDPAWRAANDQNHEFFQKYADQALARQISPGSSSGKGRKLLLESLAEEIKDPIELRNQSIHAFAAANETTACLISNIMWILARRPEIFSRLRKEVLALGDVELNFDTAMKVTYLQHVINEALRMYPVFPFHVREALVDCTLPTGGGKDGQSPVFIRAGDRFEASFVSQNRDEKIWGEDSNEFRPERWENFQPAQWEFAPFGGGPRSCVGKQKALMETSFYITRMLREFKAIEARDDREWTGEVKITAKNLHGVKIALTPA